MAAQQRRAVALVLGRRGCGASGLLRGRAVLLDLPAGRKGTRVRSVIGTIAAENRGGVVVSYQRQRVVSEGGQLVERTCLK
jgi:hypothetical protein